MVNDVYGEQRGNQTIMTAIPPKESGDIFFSDLASGRICLLGLLHVSYTITPCENKIEMGCDQSVALNNTVQYHSSPSATIQMISLGSTLKGNIMSQGEKTVEANLSRADIQYWRDAIHDSNDGLSSHLGDIMIGMSSIML